MRNFISGLLVMMMCAGAGMAAQSGAKEETRKAGQAAADAGKSTAEAAKHAGKATAKATKKGASKVKNAVTGDHHATCIDGTVQAGKTEEAAAAGCVSHGGVK